MPAGVPVRDTGPMKDLLSRRAGARPRTYPGPPHTQLDQQPDARIRAQFARRFGGFTGVEEQPTEIRFVPGARALRLAADVEAGPPEAFISGREFAHLHALPDSSLHMILPEPLATEAVEAGWGELHPLAGTAVPATTVLVYAPRDPDEIDVVLGLLQRSYEFARGT
jgi:Family of unknown function (DUF5519)